jgi:hypothetical protein
MWGHECSGVAVIIAKPQRERVVVDPARLLGPPCHRQMMQGRQCRSMPMHCLASYCSSVRLLHRREIWTTSRPKIDLENPCVRCGQPVLEMWTTCTRAEDRVPAIRRPRGASASASGVVR